MENINQNMEMDWNDTILEDGQDLVLLDEGDYNFIVTNFERGRFLGGQKIPACNKATIFLTSASSTPASAIIDFSFVIVGLSPCLVSQIWPFSGLCVANK